MVLPVPALPVRNRLHDVLFITSKARLNKGFWLSGCMPSKVGMFFYSPQSIEKTSFIVSRPSLVIERGKFESILNLQLFRGELNRIVLNIKAWFI